MAPADAGYQQELRVAFVRHLETLNARIQESRLDPVVRSPEELLDAHLVGVGEAGGGVLVLVARVHAEPFYGRILARQPVAHANLREDLGQADRRVELMTLLVQPPVGIARAQLDAGVRPITDTSRVHLTFRGRHLHRDRHVDSGGVPGAVRRSTVAK